MKCAVHPEVDAVGYCRNCGKALCGTCVRPVRDVLYCEDCLAAIAGVAPPPAVASPYSQAAPLPPPVIPVPRSGSSPAVAFVLGFFPGLGAVYNGEYNKALIHIVVFIAMCVGLSSDIGDGAEVALSLILSGFILYMAFDAMRVAKAKRLGEVATDPLEIWSKDRPIGPIVLILFGSLLLLNNFHVFSFFRLQHFIWPIVLIAVGVLMLRNRLGHKS